MNKVAAFALRRKNSILSMLEKMFCPPQPLRFWITPAYAGKSRMLCKAASQVWDHPRMCGEKSPVSLRFFALVGSPPRMRGKATVKEKSNETKGITPAYAGKSDVLRFHKVFWQDHPRVCGEKCWQCWMRFITQGSPPRMRGKGYHEETKISNIRITPAYAGKSFPASSVSLMSWDHPRVCGEKKLYTC